MESKQALLRVDNRFTVDWISAKAKVGDREGDYRVAEIYQHWIMREVKRKDETVYKVFPA